ncbi:MAG TPA: DUF898 domain-containing protein [Gammaproteobacteria bacterium]|nr:DUF898 domain-containing protein [Gammaproteobacteria bacterium]
MQAMKFNGSGSEYFKIWIVNILLTIVTLTLYYPWAKVRNRRYFYGNTELDNQNFEYHATGKQLFAGYLIAIVALIAYVVIQQVSPVGGVVVFLILFLAIPWIVWRSLIFNMRVSSYSNVRFGFAGKLGGAYFNFLLLPIFLFLAVYGFPIMAAILAPTADGDVASVGPMVGVFFFIGLAVAAYLYGVMKQCNNAYIINGSRFGQGEFKTDLKAGPFVIFLLKAIGLTILGIFGLLLLISIAAMLMGAGAQLGDLGAAFGDPEAMNDIFANSLVISIVVVMYIGLLFLSIAIFTYLQVRQREYILKNSTIDGRIGLASTMSARSLAWVSFSNLLAIIVTLGLAIPWASVRMARYVANHTQVDTSQGFSDYVSQRQSEQSSLGDQLGDAFDVDIGIGI